MKNRVLRLAVVAVLVVAMTLTMAACQKAPASYVEAPAPQAPAAAPVEDVKAPAAAPKLEDATVAAPAETPAEATDEEKLLADTGISIVASNKTFGQKVGDDINRDYIPDIVESIKINFPRGYDFTRYPVTITVDALDFEGTGTVATKPVKGDYTLTNTGVNADYTKYWSFDVAEDDPAGIYTFELTISVDTTAVDFAYWGLPAAEDPVEYVITKTVEIAKKNVEIVAPDDYAKTELVEQDPADNIVAATAVKDNATNDADDELAYEDDAARAALVAALAAKNAALWIATPSYNNSEAQDVVSTIVVAKANAVPVEGVIEEDDLVDFAEVTEKINNYTYTFVEGTKGILTVADMNEVGDVITSIMDIPTANGNDKIAQLPQYALSLERYNALTDAQKTYFNLIETVVTEKYGAEANPFGTDTTPAGAYGTASNVDGKSIVTWLTKTIGKAYNDAQAAAAAQKSWNDIVKAAQWTTYGPNFNVNDEFSMASYNQLKAWFSANGTTAFALGFVGYDGNLIPLDSDADDTNNGDVAVYSWNAKNYETYGAFYNATLAIEAVNADATVELIKGALAAYEKALGNSSTIKYNAAASVNVYLDSAEVELLAKYAMDAYNALTKREQALVKTHTDAQSTKIDGADLVKELEWLANMAAVVDSIQEVVNYVKIENYAKSPSDVYKTLYLLVYGIKDPAAKTPIAAGDVDFFGTTLVADNADTSDVDETVEGNWAVEDIITYYGKADIRAAVVAEYKAWIDTVIAFEDVKAAAVDAFDVAFNEYCTDKELNEKVIEAAETSIDTITLEILNPAVGSADAIQGATNGVKYNSIQTIVALRAHETMDEVKEYFEDAFDGEKIAKNLVYKNTAEAGQPENWAWVIE